MDQGAETAGYVEERALFKRYLSDEIAPMIFADTATDLFSAAPQIVATEIQSWIGDQIRGASNMTVSDLLAHAATKLHQLGVLELLDKDEVARYLEGLRPLLLQLCPAEQRSALEQTLGHIEKSTSLAGSKTEVLHRQTGGPSPAYPGPSGGGGYGGAPAVSGPAVPGPQIAGAAASGADPASVRRLNLLLDRLQKAIPAGDGATASEPPGDMIAHVVEEATAQASSAQELQAQLGFLSDLGIAGLERGLFQLLSQGLPDWAPPSHDTVVGSEPPAIAARAMRKVVKLSKDPDELAARFKELLDVGLESFNEGTLGRSVTVLDLAGRMIEQGDIDQAKAAAIISEGYPQLSQDRLEVLAEDPDRRRLLHRVMKFFPELRADRLLEQLVDEEDRERRLRLLKLLRAHGSDARVEAVEALGRSLDGPTRLPWHVERNLIYLMRAIPLADDGNVDHEIDLLNLTSDLSGPIQVARESLNALIHFDHPRAYAIVAGRVSELEDALQGDISLPLDAKELRLLLSNTLKQLCQQRDNEALEIVITHGLKGIPQLGDTYARLAQLSAQDLSEFPAQLARLVDAINQELPRRFLGMSIGAQRKALILDQLVTAVSGTRSPDVQRLLADIVDKFPDQSYGKIAQEALTRSGSSTTETRAPAEEDSITLSGDLALFGLPNLLQNLADNGLTGTVQISGGDGRPTAEIELAQGQMTAAVAGELRDDIAVYQMLERPMEGRFRFINDDRAGDAKPSSESSRSVMSLLMEGMRRYDEFNRARAVAGDDARFKTSGKKPTDVKEDADPKLAKAVWQRAIQGATPSEVESEIELDCFRVRRLYEHWITEGSLVAADAPADTATT